MELSSPLEQKPWRSRFNDICSGSQSHVTSSAPKPKSCFSEILQNLREDPNASTPRKLRTAWCMVSASKAVTGSRIGPPLREPLAPIKANAMTPAWRSPAAFPPPPPSLSTTPQKLQEETLDGEGRGKENMASADSSHTPVRHTHDGEAPMSVGVSAHRTLRCRRDYTASCEGLFAGAVRIPMSSEKPKKKMATSKKNSRSYMDSTAASRASIYTPQPTGLKGVRHSVKQPQKRKANSSHKKKGASPALLRGASGGKKKKRMRIQRFHKIDVKLSEDRRSSRSFHELFLENQIGLDSEDDINDKNCNKTRTRLSSADSLNFMVMQEVGNSLSSRSNEEHDPWSQESPTFNVREVATGIEEVKGTPLVQENLTQEFDYEMQAMTTKLEADALYQSLETLQISNARRKEKRGSDASKYLRLQLRMDTKKAEGPLSQNIKSQKSGIGTACGMDKQSILRSSVSAQLTTSPHLPPSTPPKSSSIN